MFKPDLTDSQRDFVIQCLDGSTLVELVRASIQCVDLEGLRAIEKNGVAALMHLKESDLLPLDQKYFKEFSNSAVDSQAMGMINAMGEIFRLRQENSDLKIPKEIRRFVTLCVGTCVQGIRSDIDSGILPRPGLSGPGLRLRKNLASLACLAIAVNDIELVGKIKQCDIGCLFSCLDGKLIQKKSSLEKSLTTTMTPLGVAVVQSRLDILKAHFEADKINQPLAEKQRNNDLLNVCIDDLMFDVSGAPRDTDTSIWIVKNLARLEKVDPVGNRFIYFSCNEVSCDEGSACQSLTMKITREAPEFYAKYLRLALEMCVQTKNTHLLAGILEKSVDWTHWNGQLSDDRQEMLKNLENFDATISQISQIRQIAHLPADHPMAMIIDSSTYKTKSELDETMSVLMRVMVNAGQSDLLLRNDLDFDMKASFHGVSGKQKFPLSFEVAQMDMVKSLEVMLSAGLDPALKFKDTSIMDSCENTQKNSSQPSQPSQSLMLLRAVHAQRQARQAIDSILSVQTLSF